MQKPWLRFIVFFLLAVICALLSIAAQQYVIAHVTLILGAAMTIFACLAYHHFTECI